MQRAFRGTKIAEAAQNSTFLSLKWATVPNWCQHEARHMAYCAKDALKGEKKRMKDKKCKYDSRLCAAAPKPKPRTFWQRFFACDEEELRKAARPPIATCRKRQYYDVIDPPDLSFIDGQPFKTCGEAYVVQQNLLPTTPTETSRETRLIKKIEQPLHCMLDTAEDPMDKITKAELRLIALHDNKLHPSYKQLDSIPKPVSFLPKDKNDKCCPNSFNYNTISGPLDPNDIPIQLKFNKDLLDKKNIMYDFKRVEPPRNLVAPIIEMTKNQRPTLEKRKRVQYEEVEPSTIKMEGMSNKKCVITMRTRSASFDTLQQGNTLLDTMIQLSEKKEKGSVKDITKKSMQK